MKYTKKEHMLLLIRMALADNRLKISERQVLQEHAENLNITAKEYHELMFIGSKNRYIKWDVYKSFKNEQKIAIIDDLIDVMQVDGHIDQREVDMLREFCNALDISHYEF